MSETTKTPWHLWVVGILALLFNGMGGLDYTMTQSGNEAYLSQFSIEEREFFTNIPTWAIAFWAISVWSAVLGSIMILLKKRWAVPLFTIALIAFIITAVHTYLLASPSMLDVVGSFAAAFSLVIFAVTALLLYYSKRMSVKGVLR